MLRTEEEAKAADAARDKAIMPIGNLVHDSVPVSNGEARALLPAPRMQAPINLGRWRLCTPVHAPSRAWGRRSLQPGTLLLASVLVLRPIEGLPL